MTDVDARLVAAIREQLARRPAGAARIGWKYGSGADEHIGGDHVVGHLTSATTLADGDTYRGGGRKLQADVETAVEADRVAAVHRVLRAVDEELRPGDRVITGLIVNTRVAPADEVFAELGELGRVGLRIG